MFRKDEARRHEWMNQGKDILLIIRACQIGKTWLISEILKHNGIRFLEISLLERNDIRKKLINIDDAREFSGYLALYVDQPIKPVTSFNALTRETKMKRVFPFYYQTLLRCFTLCLASSFRLWHHNNISVDGIMNMLENPVSRIHMYRRLFI